MTTLTETKCACPKCSCMVSLDTAIMANDKPYCSRACADGHPEGSAGCKKSAQDEQLRKHLPRMFSLIKNESWRFEDD